MRKSVHRVGAFPETLDPLMCRGEFQGVELFYLTAGGSVEDAWAAQFLPKERIISLDLDLEEGPISNLDLDVLIKTTDIAAKLKEMEIDSLIIPSIRTPLTHRWSVRNGIRILGPSYDLQRKLDNKLWFDRFLRRNKLAVPDSAILNYRTEKTLPFTGCNVIQDPDSTAGLGTFFVRSDEELSQLVKAKKVRSGKNYLVRRFVEGETYGIAVFVSPQVIALSALRKQCFFDADDNGMKVFAGIQWVPSTDFEPAVVRRVEELFSDLGRVLHGERYFGFANFDFVIDPDGEPYLIECNPRLSYASAQLFKFPELSSGVNLAKLFIEGFFRSKRYVAPPVVFGMPESSYNGSQLEVLPSLNGDTLKVRIRKEHQAGLYRHAQKRVRFRSPDIRQFKRTKRELVFYSSAKRGEMYGKAEPVGRIVANFPLFTSTGKLTRMAERRMSRFRHDAA